MIFRPDMTATSEAFVAVFCGGESESWTEVAKDVGVLRHEGIFAYLLTVDFVKIFFFFYNYLVA